MDPTDVAPSSGRFETFDANARFVVVHDDEGYGIWRLDELVEGDPIERFPDTDEGYEEVAARWKALTKQDRRQRNLWLSWLKWVVLISAVAWALSGVLSGLLFFQVGSAFDRRGFFQELFKWAQVVNSAAHPLTLGGFAAYAILWLESRRQRERLRFRHKGSGVSPSPWTSGRGPNSIRRRSKTGAACVACEGAEGSPSGAVPEWSESSSCC